MDEQETRRVEVEQETRVTRIGTLDRPVTPGEACLVQIYGPGLGKRFRIGDDALTVGRDPGNSIVIDLDTVSRRHCVFAKRDNRVCVSDLGSTNGTCVNEREVHQESVLRSGDLVKVGGAIFKFLDGGDLEQLYYEEIYRLAIVDGLTQIHNKRYFLEFLEREMARCQRYGRPLSLLMYDVDHFKRINDEHGHLAGDRVLQEIARVTQARVRKGELLARYGGEEFAIVLPEVALDKARIFADRLLELVAAHTVVFEGRSITVTISVGLAQMTREMTEPEHFIKATDAELYRAKREGRNRVCVAA